MANDKIKVIGYATKDVFNGDIEYRNFSPNLVGNQSTDGESVFTLGNFSVTTSIEPKTSKLFITNKFSNFVSLCDLDLTGEESDILLTNNSEVKLKLDKTNLCNYAYFGSLLEYVRVSLEEIITKWPASLYVTSISGIYSNKLTVEDYNHTPLTDVSTFKVNVSHINNPYGINFLKNGTIVNTFNESNDLRDIVINYPFYSIFNDMVEYKILGLTGSTSLSNDYIYLEVKGNPFNNITGTTTTTNYHIKPNKLKEETFFNTLPDFESNLLNRLTQPKYTSVYKFPEKTDAGSVVYQTKILTWPVSDGYNLDFNTTQYDRFVSNLINIATNFDESKTNLMVRFLTAESISDFDTVPRCDGIVEETAGQKMNKTLKIYGREYDDIKRYIDGIQYVNTVTYDQRNNTPDVILKYLAKTMGWDLVSSVLENNLLKNYVTSSPSSYSGMSRGYTAVEAEVEMWRRIILNTPWLWKSKGARKSIEFLFKFIGAPDGLIEFNEFIYLAKEAIDVDLFKKLLIENGLEPDISLYNVDSDGYPRVLGNTPNMYFQKGGLWYRQTAGSGSTIDILTGNNPHVGPYDGGAAYINQFNNLIPNFSAVTISSSTTTTGTTNLFTNYNSGTINTYEGDYFVDVVSVDDVDLSDCVVVTTNKILDPYPTASEITDCGCDVLEEDYALKINIECDSEIPPVNCVDSILSVKEGEYGTNQYFYQNVDEFGNPTTGNYSTKYISKECCRAFGGQSIYDETWTSTSGNTPSELINCGYLCCKTMTCGCYATCDWKLATINLSELPIIAPYTSNFLLFEKPDGTQTAVTPTGCSCIDGYTSPVSVIDPNTGENGIGCMLNETGIQDLTGESNTVYYTWYDDKNDIYVISVWTPSELETKPPENSTDSWIEAVYTAREDGLIPCDQYMNNQINDTGVIINDEAGIYIENTKR